VKLNLGCCDRHMEGYLNVDIAEPADRIVDLNAPWPWPDSSVDEVRALDIVEHIGDCQHVGNTHCLHCCYMTVNPVLRHPLGRIHFINELHRVMKPGAIAILETPDAARGVGFFQDPTHVSPWTRATFRYFEQGAFAHTRLAKHYGITAAFKILGMELVESPAEGFGDTVFKIVAKLEAVK
jgi:hypothetical protein